MIDELVRRGALFVANHSGGKDSQAMLIKLLEIVPASQMIVVHAALGEVEWEGALELAEKQAAPWPAVHRGARGQDVLRDGRAPLQGAARARFSVLAVGIEPPVHQRPEARADRARGASLREGARASS
jgi:hypothetical protein